MVAVGDDMLIDQLLYTFVCLKCTNEMDVFLYSCFLAISIVKTALQIYTNSILYNSNVFELFVNYKNDYVSLS